MADNESSREAQPEPSKDTLLRNMSDRDFELYIYSLRKMAENNLESNRTFMTELYNLRAFHYKTAELMLEHPQMKFAMIVLDFANFKSINEFCGRDVGDALLKCTADALYLYKAGDLEREDTTTETENSIVVDTPESEGETTNTEVTNVPATLISSNVTAAEILENTAEIEETAVGEIVVEETMQNTDEAAKEEKVPDTENVIAEEEVPLAVNAGGSIPMWAVLAAVLVFAVFAGVYVYAKQNKIVK